MDATIVDLGTWFCGCGACFCLKSVPVRLLVDLPNNGLRAIAWEQISGV